MTQENKPREFWIDEEESIFSDYAATYYKIDKNKYIHVIQYSAYQAEREKVRKLVELVSKILKAKRSATVYLANPCDKNEHYPSIYISYEVESWLKELEKEIEEA